MNVDVILCTYNRGQLLHKAIDTFLDCLDGQDQARLVVVDNNSSDSTRSIVQEYVDRYPDNIAYLFEGRQGKSFALNSAIAYCQAEILAFYDDDEVLDRNWLKVIRQNMENPDLDFVGGEVKPLWEAVRPTWMPTGYDGVLGLVNNGQARRRYGSEGFSAMLTGANWAVRRSVLVECGPYLPEYVYAEDRYMHNRLLAIGASGIYDPALIVWHVVPARRLTRAYFRHWAYMEGRTIARFAHMEGERGTMLLGIPLWRWRRAGEACLRMVLNLRERNQPAYFTAQVHLVEFYGLLSLRFVKERHVDRSGSQK